MNYNISEVLDMDDETLRITVQGCDIRLHEMQHVYNIEGGKQFLDSLRGLKTACLYEEAFRGRIDRKARDEALRGV